MQKPNVDLSTLTKGKIFQISPEGKDMINIQYGGDFLISCEYHEFGVQGYLACANEQEGILRYKGLAYLRVNWKDLHCVGSVEWFKQIEEENGEKKCESDENRTEKN